VKADEWMGDFRWRGKMYIWDEDGMVFDILRYRYLLACLFV
jgi:hypothetical protein